MKNTEIYNRTVDLKNKFNHFIQQFTSSDTNYFDELTQEDLIKLKLALSDVNNVLTLKTTLAFAEWISKFLNLKELEVEQIHHEVNSVKPNTNGYDIEINGNHNVVIEIKCIIPINNGNYYGAAQRNSILDDAIKLKNGKRNIPNTSGYIKIIGLIDLGAKTDQAIQKLMTPSKSMRTENQSRIDQHNIVSSLKIIEDAMSERDLNTENIFIKKIKI